MHRAAPRLVSDVTEGGAARAGARARPGRFLPSPGRGRVERGPHPGRAALRWGELVRRPLPLRTAPRVFPALALPPWCDAHPGPCSGGSQGARSYVLVSSENLGLTRKRI